MSNTGTDAVKSFNETIIDEFRANGGKVGGPFEGAPMLLLTTTGAKSGQKRTSPVVTTRDGDTYVIIASKAGAPTLPRLVPQPPGQPPGHHRGRRGHHRGRGRGPAQGAERQRLWDQQVALMPNFADYATMTTREIPVVVLTPVA